MILRIEFTNSTSLETPVIGGSDYSIDDAKRLIASYGLHKESISKIYLYEEKQDVPCKILFRASRANEEWENGEIQEPWN